MLKVSQHVNEIFAPLWEEKKRYYILLGGRGAGRSMAGSQFLLSNLLGKDFFRCAIMREVQTDIRSTVWQEFIDRVREQNLEHVLDIGDSMMTAEYGVNSIHAHGFRQSSGSNTSKLKSLANYNTVLIEEAIEVGEAEFMKLDDTLRTVKGNIKIVLLLNPPPKSHWIIQRWFDCIDSGVDGFYKIKLKDDVTDVLYLPGNYRDNLANLDSHTIRNYEAYKNHKPDYYWQEIEGLVPEVVRGKIYSGWQIMDVIPKEARLVGFGVDVGWWPHPAAVVANWYWNGAHIFDEVAYGTNLTNKFLAEEIKKYGTALTVADSAEPKSIEEMKGYKIKIEGADKGKGSVNYGIKIVSEKKIYVTRRSANIWKEYENYAWAENKDGEPKGFPIEDHSHAMDAIRYALAGQQNPVSGETKIFGPSWQGYGRVRSGMKVMGGPVSRDPFALQLPADVAKNVVFPKGF